MKPQGKRGSATRGQSRARGFCQGFLPCPPSLPLRQNVGHAAQLKEEQFYLYVVHCIKKYRYTQCSGVAFDLLVRKCHTTLLGLHSSANMHDTAQAHSRTNAQPLHPKSPKLQITPEIVC